MSKRLNFQRWYHALRVFQKDLILEKPLHIEYSSFLAEF